jgi:formamidase
MAIETPYGGTVGPGGDFRKSGVSRWPDADLGPGDEIILETPGYDDYQLQDDDDRDVQTLDLSRVHPIGGPVAVRGAEPGDLLVVDLIDIRPLSGIGYSAVLPGMGGPLRSWFPRGFKSVWDCKGGFATSRHVPGVRIPAMPHPGVIGVAPSIDLLERWNAREDPLIAEEKAAPRGAAASTTVLRTLEGETRERVARDAARTVPPRENGGNVDIKNLSTGARVYLPVFVETALFSLGDVHFAEGDGEVTWNAIDMDGATHVRLDLVKGAARTYGIRTPVFEPGPLEPRLTRWLTFTGVNARDDRQGYLDCTWAALDALEQAVEYLMKFGFSGEQAYTIISVAPVEMRISSMVDIPNACVTLAVPRDVFDRDIVPAAS